MEHILFRHEKIRKFQDLLIEDIRYVVESGKHLLAHAPTGIGKTDAVLAPTVPFAMENGMKVFYLSPKISQHEMVLKVLRDLENKYSINIPAIELVGKRYMCIHPFASVVDGEDFYEVCRKLREREECVFYKNFILNQRVPELSGVFDHTFFIENGKQEGLCPYEVATASLRDATVIIGDFYHLFSPRSFDIILKKAGVDLDSIILIVDEAHNLPERIRKVISSTISTSHIERALKEAAPVDPDLYKLLRDALDALLNIMEGMKEYEEREVDVDFIKNIFNSDEEELGELLIEAGKEYMELSGKNRSYLLKVGRFLISWKEGDEGYIRYVKRGINTLKITRRSLDPSVYSSPIFEELYSSVLVSGTLTPVEMYRDLLGIPFDRAVLREYPSPFPKENRLILIYPKITTRYSHRREEEYKRIAEALNRMIMSVPGNSAVFFPSYDVLSAVIKYMNVNRPLFIQKENMKPEELRTLVNTFRQNRERGGVLIGVAGGSLAEGVDFPGKDLIAVFIVGIPLAEVNLETSKIIEYYDEKYGRGWLYGYIYPAMTKVMQAVGRLIRSETDRGVAVLMDVRYTWNNYKKAFPREWEVKVSERPWIEIQEFFREWNL